MKLVDVIEKETTPWGKDAQIYDKEEDFQKRKEFEIESRKVWLVYLLTLILIAIISSALSYSSQSLIQFHINWGKAIGILFIISAYFVLLTSIEALEFEKVRFGEVNVRRIILDYATQIIVLLGLALWLMSDENLLIKVADFTILLSRIGN